MIVNLMAVQLAGLLSVPLTATVAQPTDWITLRNRFALTVWPDMGGKLPSAHVPSSIVERPEGFEDLTLLTWNISCKHFSLNSSVYRSVRTVGRRTDTVIIHHHGHAKSCDKTRPDNTCTTNRTNLYDFYNLTDFYHRELGSDAFFMYMPLLGPNRQQGLPERHKWFEQWQDKGTPTIKFFLEPVVLTISYALSLGYENVVMIGKSGGGWTTTLMAALDPRISLSIPIAGSIPLDFQPPDTRDYEQLPRPKTDKLWYLNVVNYTQLYALATVASDGARSRTSLQLLHEDDPCCFHAHGRHAAILAYDAAVSAKLPPVGPGVFSTAITNWNVHAVCQMDRVVMRTAKEQLDAGEPHLDRLPCDILRARDLKCPVKPPTVTA